MFENNGFSTSIILNLPVLCNGIFDEIIGYTIDNEELYCINDLQIERQNEHGGLLPITDSVFMAVLSIEDTIDAEQFCRSNPNIPVFKSSQFKNSLTTRSYYFNMLCTSAKKFRAIWKLCLQHNVYREDQTSINAYLLMELFAYDDDVISIVDEEFSAGIKGFLESEDSGIIGASKYSYSTALTAAEEKYKQIKNCYEKTINDDLSVHFDNTTATVIFKFRNINAAMLMYLQLAIKSGAEFKQCIHPNCHNYFVVDKHHPQSMCDMHMATRRKARSNQKAKGKQTEDHLPPPF